MDAVHQGCHVEKNQAFYLQPLDTFILDMNSPKSTLGLIMIIANRSTIKIMQILHWRQDLRAIGEQ